MIIRGSRPHQEKPWMRIDSTTGLLDDASATHVASLYHSPGDIGHVLVQLSTGYKADSDELLADIEATERRLLSSDQYTAEEHAEIKSELSLLKAWVEWKVSQS